MERLKLRLLALLRRTRLLNDIRPGVRIGADFRLQHRGFGVVIHECTTIGDRVTIYQGVTIGRFDAGIVPLEQSPFRHIVVEDDVVIYPGAVIIGGPGVTTIGRGSIIGANAVVLNSTGPNEVWAGNPARLIKTRSTGTSRESEISRR